MRVAIIGLGMRIAGVWKHLHAAAHGRLVLCGYADPSPTGLRVLADAGLDPGTGFADHNDLLSDLSPDAVLIGSPNHLHLDHLRAALACGCRVFIEKPVATSPEQTWAAAGLIARHGVDCVQVGLVLRSSPFFRAVQANLGQLGRLVSMEANEHLPPEHGGFLMRDWRRRRAWSGSHILEKCCHDLDLLQAIGGRVVRAASFGGRSIFTPSNQALEMGADGRRRYQEWWRGWQGTDEVFTSDGDILDHQVAICETEHGVRFTFHVNNHAADRQRRWLVIGVEGVLEGDFSLPTARVRRIYEEPRQITVGDGTSDGHYGADAAMAADLAACWLDGMMYPVSAKAALEAGLACMAIDHAQRTASIVDSREWLARLDAILP